ncbi:hypothetical protein Tsubulata_037186 [Turnera subulata]|uniref:Reverse transcriptase domain-containing protein n=1 Tax=Turnera subulata TaxID=218843 RepID=A0A9Q0G357_9ROSI|nr:hypothetical protein Tsubulata_037186 [Turnera subulata]
MKVLSAIPIDGTFNQEGPLRALRDHWKRGIVLDSFDLKSATDRWPLSVIMTLMTLLWGPTMASSMVNSTLGLNRYLVTKPMVAKERTVAFIAGQALGFYGSWSLFALSHHYLVWLAAKRALSAEHHPFRGYALLGDDIVIASEEVAREYHSLLEDLGVTISLSKSIVSRDGALEFAKRYWVKLAMKYRIISISVLQRLAGAGYRVRSRLMTSQSTRWEQLKTAFSKLCGRQTGLSVEWWLGRGNPLNPYLRAELLQYFMKDPREIRVFPEDLVFDGERGILERTVLLGWMRLWLKWSASYWTVCMNPESPLDGWFDIPICSRTWKRTNFDSNLFKFGLLWKAYDRTSGWTLCRVPRNLFGPPAVGPDSWVKGGASGRDFLLVPAVTDNHGG